ncbi:divergent polysaccharide deacetylase family protein [Salinimonas chungwhensis]|uniref:divergent polysaccharide deacetylase family protein n=1 Tax=Salinimonas chungwhensis TaxID=265425 RepID=UPI00035C24CA|nr:divergent polysaccharide deacetylase family protein [Salinimonas chungwhensis]
MLFYLSKYCLAPFRTLAKYSLIITILALLFPAINVQAESKAKIVIILDDLGYRKTDWQALTLPTAVTISVLPFTPLSRPLATQATAQGREVMLHMPMESLSAKYLGPAGLTSNMLPDDITLQMQRSLDELPQAVGVNNHMGSKLTQQALPMQAIMQVIKQRGLFFMDSRTSAQSVAEGVATKLGVPALRRHIFLDHEPTLSFMKVQFARLIHRAHEQGTAVAIAHPYPETVAFLNDVLQSDYGAELVPVSHILPSHETTTDDVSVAVPAQRAPQ